MVCAPRNCTCNVGAFKRSVWCDVHRSWSCGCNRQRWSTSDLVTIVFFLSLIAFSIGQGVS
jgi:hypothetical protein